MPRGLRASEGDRALECGNGGLIHQAPVWSLVAEGRSHTGLPAALPSSLALQKQKVMVMETPKAKMKEGKKVKNILKRQEDKAKAKLQEQVPCWALLPPTQTSPQHSCPPHPQPHGPKVLIHGQQASPSTLLSPHHSKCRQKHLPKPWPCECRSLPGTQ